ncbi:MAG: hypothetical protein NC390_04275 [Fusobacterium sp.]|nr:hypothetical protein [Fusobacterium sp.]
MKKKYKSLLMACAAFMLCCTINSEKSFGLDIVDGQTYENQTDAAHNSIMQAYGGISATVNSEVRSVNNTFRNNTNTHGNIMGMFPGGGGVIYNYNGSIFVDGSTFDSNRSTADMNKTGGGALLLHNTKSGSITNSDFIGNSAVRDGGAIYMSGTKNIVISDSNFTGNHAGGYGGAIRLNNVSINDNSITHAIHDTIFEKNSAAEGGAIYVDGTVASFDNLTFNDNTAQLGGAMAIYSSNGSLGQGITINNSHFIGNTADERGGAIYSLGNFRVNDSEFSNNEASQGGAIYIANDDPNIIENAVFTGNRAETLGGAIAVNEGTLQINNSRFEGNHAGTRGGAITYVVNSNNTSDVYPTKSLLIYNTDFINNTNDQNSGGAIYVNVSQDPEIRGGKMVRIVSNDGKTHEFTGNMHNLDDTYGSPESNALYVDSGKVQLMTQGEGSRLLFNDGIAGSNWTTTDAQLELNGDIVFNGQVKNIGVTQKGGTLTLNQAESNNLADGKAIFENVDLYLDGGKLDMANGKLDTLNLGNFEARNSEDIQLAFDADLAQGKSDFINVSKEMSGGLKFDAEHVDIKIKDGNAESFQLFNRVAEDFGWATGDELVQYSDKRKYTLSLGEDGVVNVASDTTNGLADAIIADGARVYRSDVDITLKDADSLGQMGGDYLKINLDGADLDGAGKGGIIVSDGQRLEMVNMGLGNGAKSVHDFNGSVVDNAGELTVMESVFKNNSTELSGGVLNNTGVAKIYNSSFIDNKAGENGGAINNSGKLTITADRRDVVFSGNTANGVGNDIHLDGGELTLNGAKSITFNGGISGTGNIVKEDYGTLRLGGDNSNYTGDVHFTAGETILLKDSKYFTAANTHFENGSMLNLINNQANSVNFGNLYLDGNGGRLGLDVNMINGEHDTIAANSVTGDGKLIIDKINVLYDNRDLKPVTMFDIVEKDADGNSPLLGKVELNPNTATEAYGPIYRYGVEYKPETGQMLFSGAGGKDYKGYNPAVMTGPVGALVGAYLTQLNSYDMAFNNMDMYMLMPSEKRDAIKHRNIFASTQGGPYSPTLNPHEEKGAWVKPYSTFENVSLSNGPKVHNVAYGSFFGVDSDLTRLKYGFDGILSFYAGYNGSHQTYNGNGIYQNGGQLGLTGVAYKGNFFSALTANVGANVGEASTMYGNDNFTMLMAGVASKTGYNWELARGRFIIQPSYLMSYSFINTFDYHNAAGVSLNSDALNVIQINPGLKFIGNLKNGWQPYLGFSIVWNIMDDTRFRANDVALPQLSIDPYFNYGLGVQKTAGERLTGFLQAMFRSGGRSGVGLQFAFRYKL